jgi:hypothetical protein
MPQLEIVPLSAEQEAYQALGHTVEPVDLEAVQRAWYHEPSLRLHSMFGDSLSMRAIFNPGLTPPDLTEALVTTLDALLPLFIPENADRPVGELVGHV